MLRLLVLIVVVTTSVSCSSKISWPPGMTPFFAECEGEGSVYVDKEYAKRYKARPCPGGWKYYDRGEPVLFN